MSSQFDAIADSLARLYHYLRDTQIELAHQETDYTAAVLAKAPEEGWPGKNEEQRKAARDRALADDETCKLITARISQLRDDLADCEADLEALRERRDALRRGIRERLTGALEMRYGVQVEFREPADGAFDGETDVEADAMAEAAVYAGGDGRAAGQAAMPEDEIPF